MPRLSAMAALLLLVSVPLASASQLQAQATPVQKVLEMLNGMLASGQKEQAEEAATFKDYSAWVTNRVRELGFEIKTSNSRIEDLKASIEKYDNEVAQLAEKIAGLDADIRQFEQEKKDATAVRETEKADFLALQKDYSESIDALTRAVAVVSAQAYDRPAAEMLLQRMAKTTRGMAKVLAALDDAETGAPAADAYESQSNGIQAMLEGLLKKFKGELAEVEEAESNRAHYFNLAHLHLTNSIAHATTDREEKTATKAATAAASAKAKGDLADTVKALAEQKQFLSDTKATFKSKSEAFAANQKVRTDELAAISKAVEIISSPAVSDSYAEHINLAQVPARAVSLLQTGSARLRLAAKQRAAAFLQQRAKALASQHLAAFAEQVAGNPFAKVIGMVEDMLDKLKSEAAAEASHKAWCDEELKNNKLKREKQTTAVEKLTAQVAELTSLIASQAKRIETLVKEQADLAAALQQATEQRQKENAENTKTIADAQAGSSAVKQAIVVLKEFYASQASLLQAGQVPELKAYKGQQGKTGGVVGMLEVIETDFLRLEAETKATEDRAAQEYAKFVEDSEADKLAKHNAEVKLRLQKDQAEFDRSQVEKDLAANQVELDKANEYFEYLKPNCLEIKVSYEERVAAREAEIESLREAYKILDSK